MKKTKSRLLLGIILVVCFGCNPMGSEKLKVDFKNPSSFKNLKSQVSNVSIVNNQLVISGSLLSGIKSAKLKNNSQEEVFQVESASDNQIIANGGKIISLIAGSAFDLILSDAYGSATFAVTFALDNGSVTGAKLSSMGATNGQFLKYTTAGGWAPASFSSSQVYLGTWDASANAPDISATGSFNAGDYYIVTTAGNYLGFPCAVGDWVMFDGVTLRWDKIANSSLSGTGTVNYIPYYSSSNVLANSPISILGSNIGIGTLTPGSSLDVKGTLRLSGATSGYVGFAPAAVAGATTYTLPTGPGTVGQMLTTNGVAGTPTLSWTSVSVSGGTVTSVASANGDVVVTNGTSTADLAVNTGTGANQIVKLTAAAKLPAVDGSLLTSLASANLTGTVAVANGGTGAATLGASQSALGITMAGPLIGNVPALGVGVVADRLCASDATGGTISCTNNLPTSVIENSVVSKSGTGNLLFGTGPTISNPVITNIAPAATFTLNQNGVASFTSENTSAVANTLYLKAGKVGVGTTNPLNKLHIYSTTSADGLSIDGTTDPAIVLRTNGTIKGYAPAVITGAADYFTDSAVGDFAFRSETNNILFGRGAGTSTLAVGSRVGVGTTSPTAALHLKAGSATINTAPLKFTAGTNLTTPEAGAVEFDGTNLYYTDSTLARRTIFNSGAGGTLSGLTAGRIPYATAASIVADSANFFWDNTNGRLGIGTSTPAQSLDIVGGDIKVGPNRGMMYDASNYLKQVTGHGWELKSWLYNQFDGANYFSGNVGIGATTPVSKLHVATAPVASANYGTVSLGSGAFDGVTAGFFAGSASGTSLAVNEASTFVGNLTDLRVGGVAKFKVAYNGDINLATTAYTTRSIWLMTAGNQSKLELNASGIGQETQGARLMMGGHNGFGANFHAYYGSSATNTNGDFRIYDYDGSTTATERFKIDNAGNVSVGTSTDAVDRDLFVYGRTNKNFDLQIRNGYNAIVSNQSTVVGPSAGYLAFQAAGAERIRIEAGGNVGINTTTNTTYQLEVNGTLNVTGVTTNLSDERFKKNITRVPDALEKLLSLDGVFYDYRTEEFPERNFTNRRVMGVIAQKVEKVFPEAVSRDDKGFRSVAYSMLIAPIIEAIRGLDKRITELFKTSDSHSRSIASMNAKTIKLEAENEAKAREIAELKSRLNKIEKLLLKNP
jgi:hypothetical protein